MKAVILLVAVIMSVSLSSCGVKRSQIIESFMVPTGGHNLICEESSKQGAITISNAYGNYRVFIHCDFEVQTKDTVLFISMRDLKGTSVMIPMDVIYGEDKKVSLTTEDKDLISLITSSMAKSNKITITLPVSERILVFDTNKMMN